MTGNSLSESDIKKLEKKQKRYNIINNLIQIEYYQNNPNDDFEAYVDKYPDRVQKFLTKTQDPSFGVLDIWVNKDTIGVGEEKGFDYFISQEITIYHKTTEQIMYRTTVMAKELVDCLDECTTVTWTDWNQAIPGGHSPMTKNITIEFKSSVEYFDGNHVFKICYKGEVKEQCYSIHFPEMSEYY